MVSPRILAGVLLLLPVACDSDRENMDTLSLAMAPHRETFERFETWAERAESSLSTELSKAAFTDSLFAPLRLERAVLLARVEREGTRPRTMVFPPDGELTGEVQWTRFARDGAPPLEVAVAARCPIAVPSYFRQGAGDGPCVLLSSTRSWGLAETMRVTLAFKAAQLSTADP